MEITRIDSFVGYYTRVHERTARVVSLVDDDNLEWRYAAEKFSIGDLVRHIASFNRYVFAENAQGRPSRYAGHGTDLAKGADEVIRYYTQCHADVFEIFSRLTDASLSVTCTTPGGATMPVWKWLRAMIEHEVHHRGQIYLLLGMRGVRTPPLFGLTSEEVADRSSPV